MSAAKMNPVGVGGLAAIRARSTDGEAYTVGRRWLPWNRRVGRRHVRGASEMTGEIANDPWFWFNVDFDADDWFGLALLALLLVPVLLVVIFGALEILLLLALLPVVAILRAFVVGWTIETKHRGRVVAAERVKGWRASGQRAAAIAAAIESGEVRRGSAA